MQQTHADTKSDANIASQDVGLIFVREYYTFLNKQPQRLHAFYSKDSLFLRGNEGESAQIHRGQEEIRGKIEELEFEDCKVLVTQVDSQTSANNGIIIQVVGEMCNKNEPSQKFCQTFFLAPQANGYYVLNDIFRFLKDEVNIDYYTCEDDEAQHQQNLEQQKNKVQEEQRQKKLEESEAKKAEEQKKIVAAAVDAAVTSATAPIVDGSLENKVKEEKPAPVVEQQTSSPPAVPAAAVVDQSKENKEIEVDEEVVGKKETVHLNGTSAPAAVEVNGKEHQPQHQSKKPESEKKQQPAKPANKPSGPKTWANMAANDSEKWVDVRAPVNTATAGGQPPKQPGSPLQPQTQPPAQQPPVQQQQTQTHQQQQQQQQQQGGHSHGHGNREQRREDTQIFIKNVNQHINEDMLREVFTQFGAVKGVNVVHSRNCAFLDFVSTESVHKALNQHKVHVHNHTVLAEERRHPSGGGNRFQHNRQQQNGRPYERRFQQDGHRRGGGAPRGGKSRGGGGGGSGGGNNQK